MQRFCEECGTKLEAGSQFCSECGGKIEERASQPPHVAKTSSSLRRLPGSRSPGSKSRSGTVPRRLAWEPWCNIGEIGIGFLIIGVIFCPVITLPGISFPNGTLFVHYYHYTLGMFGTMNLNFYPWGTLLGVILLFFCFLSFIAIYGRGPRMLFIIGVLSLGCTILWMIDLDFAFSAPQHALSQAIQNSGIYGKIYGSFASRVLLQYSGHLGWGWWIMITGAVFVSIGGLLGTMFDSSIKEEGRE